MEIAITKVYPLWRRMRIFAALEFLIGKIELKTSVKYHNLFGIVHVLFLLNSLINNHLEEAFM